LVIFVNFYIIGNPTVVGGSGGGGGVAPILFC
jgi:hypothetical protein